MSAQGHVTASVQGLRSSSRSWSAWGERDAAPDRHLGAVVSKSSRSMRGTKGAKAGSALETVLLCQRRAVKLVLTILRRSSTLLRCPRPLCAVSGGVALLSKAAAGTLPEITGCTGAETGYQVSCVLD